jgi:hypothetical protein
MAPSSSENKQRAGPSSAPPSDCDVVKIIGESDMPWLQANDPTGSWLFSSWVLVFLGPLMLGRSSRRAVFIALIIPFCSNQVQSQDVTKETVGTNSVQAMDWVRVSNDKRTFVLDRSGKVFVPWGFNYDHDEDGRLIEDYWNENWRKIEEDFHEMKQLGATVVRIHLQVSRFMRTADQPNEENLKQFSRLIGLAERLQLRLDVTGLGCYHKKDVPVWYDDLDERGRWAVQARFWEAIAERGAKSPAIFCYDLMNEPVVPGGDRQPKDWLGPPFAGSCFVQCITLSQADRPRWEIARQWIAALSAAIRKHDRRHLITVGLVDWSLDRPGLTSGFVPQKIADHLDFLCVHLYPKTGKVKEALATLSGFAAGKPIVIEETFPLSCPVPEFEKFLNGSKKDATGWIGFYWGKTYRECRQSTSIADAMMLGWLEFFEKKTNEFAGGDEPSAKTDK